MVSNKNFGDVITALKEGRRVTRNGWNGKGMYLYYVPAASYPAVTEIAKAEFGEDAMVPYEAYVAMKNAQGTISIWAPSQVDMFAEDWIIL